MATITLTFDTSDVHKTLRALKTRYPRAIARALNRAGTSARAYMASTVAKDVGLKVGTVRDQIVIEKATETTHVVRIAVKGKRIPLIEFHARGPEPSRGRGRGVSYRLPGGAGRLPHAFIATVGTGRHRGVFMRRGPGRLPIRELFGPSLPHVFAKHMHGGLARGEESLRKNLVSELRFAAEIEG